ncbi:MAG: flippase [Alphaproteobacteria bacterium]|nr:flippase [Alphaproteobacteria bacterium]
MIAAGRVTNNIMWNFAGNVLPLVVGVLTFPLLLKGLGVERFGLLGIAWVLVGYFSLFDLGLSRAITHIVADRLGLGDLKSARGVASTALLMMWGFGLVAAVVVWALSPWLVDSVLSMPATLKAEASLSFRLLALSIPFVIHTAGLRGVLEAHHAFREASLIRTVLGIGTYLGPLAALPIGGSLVHVSVSLIFVRLVGWFIHKRAVGKIMPLDKGLAAFDRTWLKPLFTFGGWMTITNIVGPLMVYLDRFLIGAILSVAAISYYIVPYEVVTRLWIVPAAISGVLFPVFSAHFRADSAKAAHYLQRGMLYVVILLFPVFAGLSYLAPELLGFWLGDKFAQESAHILCWLAAGALMGSIAQMNFALIQGGGRSDWTGKLHLVEAIPYWLFLFWMLDRFGVVGAAVAWFARTAIDALALIWLTGKMGAVFKKSIQTPVALTIVTTALVLVPLFVENAPMRLGLLAITLITFFLFTWRFLIFANERAWALRMLFIWRKANHVEK